jgi:hypothetical protein
MKIIFVVALAAAFTAGQAYAICAANTDVTSIVTPSDLSYTYAFSVFNGCVGVNQTQPLLNDFFLPYFSDAGIGDIVAPTGWSYSIDTSNNLFDLSNAGVIEFEAATPLGYNYATGFSYTANYAGINGPFAINLTTGGVPSTLFGDPLIPGSPDAVAALGGTAVPEPSTTALLAIALCAMMLGLRRRSHRRPTA